MNAWFHYRLLTSQSKHVLPQPTTEQTAVLDSTQSRFYGRHSAAAFPHLLGLELEADPVPRLNCHAWNLELRDRPVEKFVSNLTSALEFSVAKGYWETFFARVHPVFGFLDPDIFSRRSASLWEGQGQGSSFECLAAAVIALGSYFSDEPHEYETEIAKLCDDLLHDTNVTRILDPCHIGAMVYNCIYMRLTNSPTTCWMRSCSTMHAAESIGLHKDFDDLASALNAPQVLDLKESNYRSRMFWVSMSLHHLLAAQSGRAAVQLEDVTCKYPFTSPEESPTAAFCELGRLLPNRDLNNLLNKTTTERTEYFSSLINNLQQLQKAHSVVSLNAADVCFCAYRRLLVTGAKPHDKRTLDSISSMCGEALTAAEALVAQSQPWWNIIDTTFQMVTVLISLDTPQHLNLLRHSLKVLERVSERYDNISNQNAFSTANGLVQALIMKKRRDLSALDALSSVSSVTQPRTEGSAEGTTGDEALLSQSEMPDLFARWTDPFAWSESAGVEWNYQPD